MSDSNLEFATTADGWLIALHHYPGVGPRRRHAVVCCHGLGSNSVPFDAAPEASIARHLASRGYDVFALELRGHGQSERPSFGSKRRFGWAFDDYLLRDMPAAIAHAARLSDRGAVHWIGHSMGGLLLYAHLAMNGSPSIRSGIAVGSSLDYSASRSGFHGLLPLRRYAHHLPAVPIGPIARAAAAFVGRVATPFERFNVWSSNVNPATWRHISANGFHWVSTPVMVQLSTAMDRDGLRSRDGAILYGSRLKDATAPVLSLAGDRDAQCPPDAAKGTNEALGSKRREHKVFGMAEGHADHYGHFDLLMGKRAASEVWPHMDAWIDEHD